MQSGVERGPGRGCLIGALVSGDAILITAFAEVELKRFHGLDVVGIPVVLVFGCLLGGIAGALGARNSNWKRAAAWGALIFGGPLLLRWLLLFGDANPRFFADSAWSLLNAILGMLIGSAAGACAAVAGGRRKAPRRNGD
jgi:hypothetical protein